MQVKCVWYRLVLLLPVFLPSAAEAELRAGAFAADTTPTHFPAVCGGNFTPTIGKRANSKLHARTLVLDDGTTKLAICVVDECIMPEDLLNEIKRRVFKSTGIPIDRISISATHNHSSPCLIAFAGVPVDEPYKEMIVPRIAEGIERAAKDLRPVKVGWAVAKAWDYTHCRQWIYRPDRMLTDPYGERTVRVNMHPGLQNPNVIGPSGPADPDLSMLSVQTLDGKPQALLANFSMHYFGADAVSADYFGLFCEMMQKRIAPDDPSFMVALSQGTSGDLQWNDYGKPDPRMKIDRYTGGLADIAERAYKTIKYDDKATLAMAETDLHLKMRTADEKRLEWARKLTKTFEGRLPITWPEAYAVEALTIDKAPERDVKLQAIRIGDLGITTLSCEVFGLTGLKIKAQSPMAHTFNIELANDEDGYLPPPELHPMGGYTTWPSRWAGLETGAEPKIADAVVGLLEKISGKPRRPVVDGIGSYARAVLDAKPLAYWRLNEWGGPTVADAMGNLPATMETGVLFYLQGPSSSAFEGEGIINRAPHFAGGRMRVQPKELGSTCSVEFWFWNGLANEARDITGVLISRGTDGAKSATGERLMIGGKSGGQGRLVYLSGDDIGRAITGKTAIAPKTWNHVDYVRDGRKAIVYLNGNAEPELIDESNHSAAASETELFFGGGNDNGFNFEGRLDEVALYRRVVSGEEAAAHFKTVTNSLKTDASGQPVD